MSDDSRLDFLLKQMAEEHQPELPSPGLVWWRAQILRKQQEKDRIERPMIIMRWLAAAVCAAAAVMLAGNWGVFRTATAGTYPWLLPLVILTVAVSVVSIVASLRSPASKS
jgi:fatty acid desaturase